jgi:hypothetical protein
LYLPIYVRRGLVNGFSKKKNIHLIEAKP